MAAGVCLEKLRVQMTRPPHRSTSLAGPAVLMVARTNDPPLPGPSWPVAHFVPVPLNAAVANFGPLLA
jgi:hypothetical protein